MESIDSERILITRHEDGVVEVQLNRPAKMNAIDARMFRALIAAGESLQADVSVKAIVLSGAGRAFCAGLDMASFERIRHGHENVLGDSLDDLVTRTHGIANAAQNAAYLWRTLAVPVIAVIHGVAYGGGLQIALGADIRFVTSDARLSVLEIKWGLVPDMAGVLLTRQLLRTDVARELFFSGRIVGGDEAVTLGLATRACADPYADALSLAREIAGRSPSAIRSAKRLLNAALRLSDAEILLAESREQQQLLGSPNQVEAVKAGIEGRRPVFAYP